MKKILLIFAVILLLLILLLLLFYLWGSSGKLKDKELTEIKDYKKNSASVTDSHEKKLYKIMTYNIGYLSGMTNNKSIKPDKNFFEENMDLSVKQFSKINPDFIAFQEIDFKSKRSYYVNQLDELATRLDFDFSSYAVNWDKNYVPFPYFPINTHFGEMLSGQAILSKYPIIDNNRTVLQKSENNPFYYNAFYLDRLVQISTIKMDDFKLIIMNVHLEAFDKKTREKQSKSIVNLYNEYKEYPMFIVGDFNTVPLNASKKRNFEHDSESDYENEITIKHIINETKLKEAFPITKKIDNEQEKQFFTYSSKYPESKIDYIFYTPGKIELVNSYRADAFGEISDHLPLVMEFSFN